MTLRITDAVRRLASSAAQQPAVIDVGEHAVVVWTWEELWHESGRIAGLLRRLGVKPGEAVAYQLPNCKELVAVSLGALRIGAICCPLMPIFRERELRFMLDRARARVVLAAEEHRGRRHAAEIASLEADLPLLAHLIVARIGAVESALPATQRISCSWLHRSVAAASADEDVLAAPRDDFLAQLLFTSGTTGVPKGVLHRHDVLTRAAALQRTRLGLHEGDRIFIPSPLAHQTGFLYGMWVAFTLGVPQIVQAVWQPQRALQILHEWRGTFVQAAPTFLADIVRAVQAGAQAPSSLRLFVPTGATVPRTLAREAEEVLHTRICGAFGTTEGCLATLAAPDDSREKAAGSDGRALPGVSIRVCNDAGRELPKGEEGHLQTLSPTMFAGYLEDPETTARAYTPDGWYRTADLAVIDAEGFLHITGRVNDVINRGGEKIPVGEIEQLLYQHAAVAEVAIVAMPDPRLGERACAFIVPRDKALLDLPALQAFLDRHRVARQYWPERVELVEALPKTPSGKIQKYVLRERTRALPVTPTTGALT